ncbi:monoheme cytochrome C [Polaribacter litorisediminis]|uniref:monoheme cytochrome C n=1 Tax=Polaribacter litorisediminis TaxID=1908341 RepID=UPI001CC0B718|nr:monoheme cytochrome C [Polaribacter litorisediminis]UAM96850.1 monoheme cytochrome C [Polaribacter litorisediminis]
MEDKEFQKKIKKAERTAYIALFFSFVASVLLLIVVYNPTLSIFEHKSTAPLYTDIVEDEDKIENGIHIRTGLIEADGLMTVVNNCTNCHSAKLVTQNRMSAESWNNTIKWMQETQNLWDLGANQEIIVNYLVTNYPPIAKGRRMTLTNIDWYELKN